MDYLHRPAPGSPSGTLEVFSCELPAPLRGSASLVTEVVDRVLAGGLHGLADVPIVDTVTGVKDDSLERMPAGLRVGFPPGDLDGHPAPALGLHHRVALMLRGRGSVSTSHGLTYRPAWASSGGSTH